MKPIFFSKSEARAHLGNRVVALTDFPSVPAGTRGEVVRAKNRDHDYWVVCVEWKLPRQGLQYFATILNLSFNYRTQPKAVTDEFSKDEFERLVSCWEAVDR